MRLRSFFLFSLLLPGLSGGTLYAATPDEIKAVVEARYSLTVPGFWGDFKTIGSVLSVQQEGLRADRPTALFKPNVIADGRLATAGGGTLPLGGDLDSRLHANDRLYLYGIRSGADYVDLELFTVKSFVISGTKGPTPLQATTRFSYAGGLAAVTSRQIMADIALWFRVEEEARQAAAGRGTKIIQHGQTEAEVTAIFGPPEKKILLGTKSVFVYRDVKVVFSDGKVVDAE